MDETDRPAEEAGGWHEEIVELGRRQMPYSRWEGEILVRAAGWVAIWSGAPLSPFVSVRGERSLRAWAAYCMVWLAALSGVLLAFLLFVARH